MEDFKPLSVPARTHRKIKLMATLTSRTMYEVVADAVDEKYDRESLTRLVDPGERYVTNAQEADND